MARCFLLCLSLPSTRPSPRCVHQHVHHHDLSLYAPSAAKMHKHHLHTCVCDVRVCMCLCVCLGVLCLRVSAHIHHTCRKSTRHACCRCHTALPHPDHSFLCSHPRPHCVPRRTSWSRAVSRESKRLRVKKRRQEHGQREHPHKNCPVASEIL